MTFKQIAIGTMLLFGALQAKAQQAVTTADVNLHEAPAKKSKVVEVVTEGATVTIVARRAHYDSVRAKDATGWIYERYLKENVIEALTAMTTNAIHVAAGDYHACADSGKVSPKSSQHAKLSALNRLKNRATAPSSSNIDPNFTLANIMHSGADDSRFSADKGGVVEGIVIDVHPGDQESVNCGASDVQYKDTHIEVAVASGAVATKRMIVEVTPRWRAAMAGQDDWSTAALKSLCGHKVKFTGWIFWDAEHRNASENTAPGVASDWRATAWEVHPVTSIKQTGGQAVACLTK